MKLKGKIFIDGNIEALTGLSMGGSKSEFIGLDFYNLGSNQLIDSIYFLPKPEVLIEESNEADGERKEGQIIN